MDKETDVETARQAYPGLWRRLLVFFTVFGPATITAMADNDAGGVATYSVAGATLGYPISRRFLWDGFPSQAFQKAVLQWQPGRGTFFVNVFDRLSPSGVRQRAR